MFQQCPEVRLPLGQGIAGHVASTGHPLSNLPGRKNIKLPHSGKYYLVIIGYAEEKSKEVSLSAKSDGLCGLRCHLVCLTVSLALSNKPGITPDRVIQILNYTLIILIVDYVCYALSISIIFHYNLSLILVQHYLSVYINIYDYLWLLLPSIMYCLQGYAIIIKKMRECRLGNLTWHIGKAYRSDFYYEDSKF